MVCPSSSCSSSCSACTISSSPDKTKIRDAAFYSIPYFLSLYFTYWPFADILAAGADGEPAAVAADVGEDLRRGLGVDLSNEVLVDVILFLETEVFHGLCIVALDLFLRVAEVLAQLLGQQEQRVSVEKVRWMVVPGTSRS